MEEGLGAKDDYLTTGTRFMQQILSEHCLPPCSERCCQQRPEMGLVAQKHLNTEGMGKRGMVNAQKLISSI